MKLADRIRDVAGRLGIVRLVAVDVSAAGPGSQIERLKMRNVSLKDLAADIRADEVRALAEMPAELSVPFAAVFEAAGVKPPEHGWTIERLSSLLKTDQYKAMDRPSVQKAVLGLLANDKVQAEDLVKDAVARDNSLDAFETFVRKKMGDRNAARQRRTAACLAEIKSLEEECSRHTEEGRADEERLAEWIRRKSEYETEMAWALGHLMDKPIVSVTAARRKD